MPRFVYNVVRSRNWREFSKHPQPAVIPIVREFYANFPKDDVEWVYVKGSRVFFDSRNINSFFQLPDEEDGYEDYLSSLEDHDWDEMLLRVCALAQIGKSPPEEFGQLTGHLCCLKPKCGTSS